VMAGSQSESLPPPYMAVRAAWSSQSHARAHAAVNRAYRAAAGRLFGERCV